jgi:hypothetical protein
MRNAYALLITCSLALSHPVVSAAEAGPQAPATSLAPVAKALDFLQIDFQYVDDASEILFEVPTVRYGYPGPTRLWLNIIPFTVGQSPIQWYQLQAQGIYSLSQCRHLDAARRTILESGLMLGTDVQFLYDGSNGLVTAQMAIPAPRGEVPADLLRAYIDITVNSVDRLHPILQRAKNSGFIDWPAKDRGPKEPQGELKIAAPDGSEAFTVAWAPWIEERILSSTIVTMDPFLRRFSAMHDEERERLGRELTDYGGVAGDNSFAGWMRIADHIEQSYPPIAFRFWGPPGAEVSATARIPGFSNEATATGVIDSMGYWDVEIMPQWNIEALAALEAPRKVTVEFTVECNGQKTSGTQEVTIEPPSVADVGLGFLATAKFVNEDHPWVRSIISEANASGISRSLGITGQEPYDDCVRQIYAVWKAMRNRGINYVTIHENANESDAPSQTIRQFHEAISENGANCADGSAAFASVLRKLGFDVWLIHPPGHVFVAVGFGDRFGDPDREWIFLETTLLGVVEPDPIEGELEVAEVRSQIPERHRGEDWETFLVACEAGEQQVDDEDTECQWVSLKAARQLGLTPIPALSGDIGRIPSPPKDLESVRKELRAARQAEKRFMEYLFRLPNVPACVPYPDFEAMMSDVDAIESDPAALRRLLASVPGDTPVAKLARITAAQDSAMAPAFAAAISAFGSLPGRAFPTLGVQGNPWELEIEREESSVMITIRPLDRLIERSWIRCSEESGRWHMTEDSLMDDGQPWVSAAFTDIGERMNPGSLARIGRELADRIERREIGNASAFETELAKAIESIQPSEEKLRELAERER